MDMHFLSFAFVLVYYFKITDSVCSWPAVFQSSTWRDSTHGDLVFDTTTMTGFTYIIDGQTVNDWTCVVADTFETDGRLILLSSYSFTYVSEISTFYAYLCMTFTKVTDASYRYYQNNAEDQIGTTNYRIFIYPVNSVTSPGTLCDDSNGANGPEYQVMIRTGSEATARVDCPFSFLGAYGYIHTDSSGVVTCDTENSSWETCTDNTLMTFDYTQCSTKVAYSATDTVWCVDNVPTGGTNYVMVYNGGESETTIDNINIFRYACFAISEDSTMASVTPQHCKAGQTTTDVPTNNAGVLAGATLEMVVKKNCSSCPMLAASARGLVSVSTDGAVTKATYECESNYTLAGVSERICQENNTWRDTAPSCSCVPPPTPSNGARVISADGHQANYSCDVGFSLKGLQIRDCVLETVEWEDVDPECVQCATIDTPAGGTPTYSTDGVTTQVSFACDKSYSLAGTVTLNCLTNGSWDEATPTCAKCPSLTNPISGSVSTSTDGIVTKAAYSCSSVYEMIGESQLICLDTGAWDINPPKCVCQSPTSPDHGNVVANGSVAVYTCELGYTISGVTSRTCKSDGTGWSESDPTCSLCVTINQPVGGAVALSTDGMITKARYTCERGYTLSGTVELFCQSNGLWDSDFSVCAQCQRLTAPTSGTFSLSSSETVTSAIYSCFEGYDLNGATTRQCLADGSWEGANPICTCQSPPSIINGELTSDGSAATYTCQLGYSLSGPQSRSCQTDGSGWTGSDPSCVICSTLDDPTGGTVARTTDGINTQASYTCQSGYTLNGASTITCTSDGSWDVQQPTCVSCPSLAGPDSGEVMVSTDGYTSTATFSCVSGYYISGAVSLTCGTSGSWDNTPPTCKCTFPATPNNGEVAVSDAAGVSVATYQCQNGFTLSGLSTRQCQTEGAGWQGSDPICVLCEALSSPTSGQFSYSTNGIMTKATFLCDIYTSMVGENILSCQTDGSWDNPVPTCVNCSALNSPASGSVSVSTDGVTSTAFYSCVSGYSLSSTAYLTCGSDGTWTLPAPFCICDPPPSPTNGIVTVSNNGLTATYSCNAGFELLGTSVRSCLSDGTGWNDSHPICVAIPPTTTTTEKPSDIVSVHVVVIIIFALVIAIMMILMIVFAVLYFKVKKTRIGSSSERLMEEPEKPNLMPEVPVPPSDTAKIDPKKPPHLPLLKPKKKTLRKPKKVILSKLQKRPVLEKSPTVVSASGIDVENLQTEVKDKNFKDVHKDTGITSHFLKDEKKESKTVSSKSIKKPLSKELPPLKKQVEIQEKMNELPKPLSPSLPSISSMEIPIFDDVQPIIADGQPMTDETTTAVLQFEEPKETSETADESTQNNETITATNVSSVRLPPVVRPATSHGLVIKRKRKRLGFRNISFRDDIRETRPRTPIEKRMRELGIDRIMTPDLLEQVAFNYIHPVIIHDAPSSAKGGRPNTAMSSRTFASYT